MSELVKLRYHDEKRQIHPLEMMVFAEKILDRVKERYKETNNDFGKLIKFYNDYPEHDLPWLWHSLVLHYPMVPTVSIAERLYDDPWKSDDLEIQLVWKYIISKNNYPNLLKRKLNFEKMNKHATQLLDAAIQQCLCGA